MELVCSPHGDRSEENSTDEYARSDGTQKLQHDYITVSNDRKISRVKGQRIVYNRAEDKKYKIVYNKLVIQKDSYDTLPYGF